MFEYIDPTILPMGLFLLFCSVFGILGNALMVLCTLKTKRFRSPCHILICLTCLSDILHLSGHLPFCLHLFGNLSSTQSGCYFMQIFPIIGLTITGPLILAMGIDRFIAIKFLTKYRYLIDNPRCYLSVQLIFPIIYSIFFLVYGAVKMDTTPQNRMICELRLALNGPVLRLFIHLNGIILLVVFLVYLTVFVILKMNKTTSKFRAVFRSIAVIVSFLLFGWMTTMLASVATFALPLEPRTFYIIGMYTGIPVNLANASNVLVFYLTNSEYRAAIKSIVFRGSKTMNSEPDKIFIQQGKNSNQTLSRSPIGSVANLSRIE